jgi:homoserine dehydrogenase
VVAVSLKKFEGPGAGAAPTASAVLADVIDIARDAIAGRRPPEPPELRSVRVRPPEEHEAAYYLRLTVADRAGVLARIAGALGGHDISIASVIQFQADSDARTAELVITTHIATRGALDRALDEIRALDDVPEIGNVLPMIGASSRAGDAS